MDLENLRYSLTNHRKRIFLSEYENYKLLIHPSIYKYDELIGRVKDDIDLMPKIKTTPDNVEIKFYDYNYNKNIYSKSELLTFIYASINSDWNIIKGIDLLTWNTHFWLKNGDVIFDPSLSIITSEEIYSKKFKQLKEIKNQDIKSYLGENNNLYMFYDKGVLKYYNRLNYPSFSLNFINNIIKEFNRNVESQYMLDDEKIKRIKEYFMHDDFIELRQVLSQKRKSFFQSGKIAVYPSIDNNILETIEQNANSINALMRQEYDMDIDYFDGTLGNCYALSILFNLYDGDFKLVQGGIPYQRSELGKIKNYFYQHSWLEKDNIVYDPALRVVTPMDLYYIFVQKQDVYSKEETECILKQIGFNLTHFRDFLNGVQIGNDETIRYRCLVNKIDSPEMREEGEKLIRTLKR